MQVERMMWTKKSGWNAQPRMNDAQLVLYFGGPVPLKENDYFLELQKFYSNAHILGCSTGGEIYGADVIDDSVVVAAMRFEKTTLHVTSTDIDQPEDSFEAGRFLANQLNKEGLSNIFLLSDSTHIRGSELVRGLYDVLDDHIIVTGGLAGDGADFKQTAVGLNERAKYKRIAAVGFYGSSIHVNYGCVGGWSPFGPKRTITKSEGNVLYELDNKPALDLYKQYLGEEADKLPASGLLFPLSIKPTQESQREIVRTMMAINEQDKSITFADEVPTGYIAQLMRGDFSLLVDGASKAAGLAQAGHANSSIAILVSCIGRKLLLGQSISDETEAVAEVFDHKIPTIGFYSYGEICHEQYTDECSLHNQTMTITVLYED
ncbi:MAG: hypothetical protein A3J37_00330 [Alphaproteobacteria bacterium RIFCSPHIGHO2_12_FULL_45_9]|nr:MAG: hypothetical protein A3J37_00330 [Alphaproteobacteria bacterium RIFCSPHIGHO2_12_FULL_45_9]